MATATATATATLADSLLDDLDDLSDVEEAEEEESESVMDQSTGNIQSLTNANVSVSAAIHGDDDDDGDIAAALPKKKRLIDDMKLQSHLSAIQSSMASSSLASSNDNTANKLEEGQYQLMTSSNKFLIAVQNELNKAHEDLIHAYNPKFPELQDLIPNPIAFKEAIKVIQNEMDLTLVNEQLTTEANLTPNQIITLSVASSTTQGEPLTPQQLAQVNQCITYMEQILDIKAQLISFVGAHMERLAPNTCVLIGPTLAARMVATAGGMAELSRIPACNLQVLGQIKATSASRAGMSTSIAAATAASNASLAQYRISKPHEGMLSECELYNRVPGHLQRKALKVIAAKLALAVRCDFVNLESGRARTNISGMKFRGEIEKTFAKLIEPDMAPVVKALPK